MRQGLPAPLVLLAEGRSRRVHAGPVRCRSWKAAGDLNPTLVFGAFLPRSGHRALHRPLFVCPVSAGVDCVHLCGTYEASRLWCYGTVSAPPRFQPFHVWRPVLAVAAAPQHRTRRFTQRRPFRRLRQFWIFVACFCIHALFPSPCVSLSFGSTLLPELLSHWMMSLSRTQYRPLFAAAHCFASSQLAVHPSLSLCLRYARTAFSLPSTSSISSRVCPPS